jgi:mRNA-degrading endonuclease RelE of RelBE toxin-antitoxin system
MTYNLDFHPEALKEWDKLNSTIKVHFKKKLKERLENPRVQKDKLSGYAGFRGQVTITTKYFYGILLKI